MEADPLPADRRPILQGFGEGEGCGAATLLGAYEAGLAEELDMSAMEVEVEVEVVEVVEGLAEMAEWADWEADDEESLPEELRRELREFETELEAMSTADIKRLLDHWMEHGASSSSSSPSPSSSSSSSSSSSPFLLLFPTRPARSRREGPRTAARSGTTTDRREKQRGD
jgi:hypothetical protein